MITYTPPNIPELEVFAAVLNPGQQYTHDQPGFQPEIEINDIKVNGDYVSLYLFNELIEQHGLEWETAIVNGMISGQVAA